MEVHPRPLIGPVTTVQVTSNGNCPTAARTVGRFAGFTQIEVDRAAVRAADRSLARVVLFRPCIPGPGVEPARRRRPELDHDEVVSSVAVGAPEHG